MSFLFDLPTQTQHDRTPRHSAATDDCVNQVEKKLLDLQTHWSAEEKTHELIDRKIKGLLLKTITGGSDEVSKKSDVENGLV